MQLWLQGCILVLRKNIAHRFVAANTSHKENVNEKTYTLKELL